MYWRHRKLAGLACDSRGPRNSSPTSISGVVEKFHKSKLSDCASQKCPNVLDLSQCMYMSLLPQWLDLLCRQGTNPQYAATRLPQSMRSRKSIWASRFTASSPGNLPNSLMICRSLSGVLGELLRTVEPLRWIDVASWATPRAWLFSPRATDYA